MYCIFFCYNALVTKNYENSQWGSMNSWNNVVTSSCIFFKIQLNFDTKQKPFSAFIPPAICLCMLHFVGCHRYLVVVLLCATLGINGFNFSAVTCNQLDIAPKFAGTLMGITNSVGNIMGFLAPQISGAILNGHVSLYRDKANIPNSGMLSVFLMH